MTVVSRVAEVRGFAASFVMTNRCPTEMRFRLRSPLSETRFVSLTPNRAAIDEIVSPR